MSLSSIAKALLLAVLATFSVIAWSKYAPSVAGYLSDARDVTARDARISKRFIAYRILPDRPLAFAFSQPVTIAKILVHPSVNAEARDQKKGFIYGLRMRWIGSEGEELASHDAFLQADAPAKLFKSGEKWRFFRTRPEFVAGQDHLLVESPVPAMRLEIEILEKPDGVVGIDARVYEQRAFLGSQSLTSFQRLSNDSRDLLSEPNAFPVNMLSDDERLELGRNHWRAVGPLGLNGRDYTMLVLYEALSEDVQSNDLPSESAAQ